MKLEEYLNAIENCADEIINVKKEGKIRYIHRLTWEFGIYDNWTILLNADSCRIVKYLRDLRGYKKIGEDSDYWDVPFIYVPRAIRLDVKNSLPLGFITSPANTEDKEGEIHQDRQEKEFNMGVILHPTAKKRIPKISSEKAMVRVIKDISTFAKRENIPLCFPHSVGWNDSENYSKIVYYP